MSAPVSFRFPWSKYKSDGLGSESVQFSGGFRLYVLKTDRNRKICRHWRVTWYPHHEGAVVTDLSEVPADEMPGLTDKKFRTKNQAKKAAEAIFVAVSKIAVDMVASKTQTRSWCSTFDPEN